MQQCNITSFDAHWTTDNKVDQPEQLTEHSECYGNTVHTCESVTLGCYSVAECSILYMVLHLAMGNHPHKLATSPSCWMCCRQGQPVHKGCSPTKNFEKNETKYLNKSFCWDILCYLKVYELITLNSNTCDGLQALQRSQWAVPNPGFVCWLQHS